MLTNDLTFNCVYHTFVKLDDNIFGPYPEGFLDGIKDVMKEKGYSVIQSTNYDYKFGHYLMMKFVEHPIKEETWKLICNGDKYYGPFNKKEECDEFIKNKPKLCNNNSVKIFECKFINFQKYIYEY